MNTQPIQTAAATSAAMSTAMSTPTDSRNAYTALARLAIMTGDNDGDKGDSNSEDSIWVEPLAALLAAAAQGTGHLNADALLGDRDRRNIPQHLLCIEHNKIMLPRIASAWKTVREWVENKSAHADSDYSDSDIHNELDAILPRFKKYAEDSQEIIFDNAHQRLAVSCFIDRRFGVLTGGPGTGKTTTAAAFLALHKRLRPDLDASDVLVCAPTGKASQRLQQSLHNAASHLHIHDSEKEFLHSIQSITIHRALEWCPKSPEDGGPFLRQKNNRLSQSLIIIDEASMCDIELMAAFIQALPENASLLLLGDRDQLDSVEAGGVLGELVLRGAAGSLSSERSQQLAIRCNSSLDEITQWRSDALPSTVQHLDTSPLLGTAIGLYYSWRAAEAQWVLELAACVRPGASSRLQDIHNCFEKYNNNQQKQLTLYRTHSALINHCQKYWTPFINATANWNSNAIPDANEIQKLLMEFQLLCATNDHVIQANRAGCALATGPHPQPQPQQKTTPGIVHGCPVLIEANMRALNIFNGDIGIAIGDGPTQPARWILFPDRDNHQQLISLAQLPQHRPAFALTIHKSQGSEWKNIAIEVPHNGSELLDRKLLYTAITRSSGSVSLCASDPALQALLDA